jgi:hypothetical protein
MNNESSFEQCVFSARNARRLAKGLRKPNNPGKKNEISTAEYWKNAAKQRRKATKTKKEKLYQLGIGVTNNVTDGTNGSLSPFINAGIFWKIKLGK